MKKSSYMIGIAALLVVAAFAIAGVASVDADAGADSVPANEVELDATGGETVLYSVIVGDTITIKVVPNADYAEATDAVYSAETKILTITVDQDGKIVSNMISTDPGYISWECKTNGKVYFTFGNPYTDSDVTWTKESGKITATPVKVDVKYVNGEVNTTKTQLVKGEKIALMNFEDVFPNVDKTYFLGWMIGTTTYTEGSEIEPETIEGSSVTAKFQTFDVKYMEKDGQTAIGEVQKVIPGTEITLKKDGADFDPKKEQFIGWNIKDDEAKALYAPEAKYTVSANVTFVAAFNNGYEITFIAGDTSTKATSIDTIGTYTAPVPAKEGYTFAGWFDENDVMAFDDMGAKTEPAYNFTADTTLTAKFEPVKFTVTLMESTADDAKVFQTQTVLFGDVAIEPKSDYAKWVYKVVEKDAEGNDVVKFVDFDFSTVIEADLTIYGVMPEVEPVTVYNVTFEIEGKNPVVQKSDSIAVPNTAREGFNFVMWVVKGAPNQPVNPLNYEYTEDVTFIAVYEKATPAEPGFFETPTGKCVAILAVFVLGFLLYKAYPTVIAPRLEKVTKKGGKKE